MTLIYLAAFASSRCFNCFSSFHAMRSSVIRDLLQYTRTRQNEIYLLNPIIKYSKYSRTTCTAILKYTRAILHFLLKLCTILGSLVFNSLLHFICLNGYNNNLQYIRNILRRKFSSLIHRECTEGNKYCKFANKY